MVARGDGASDAAGVPDISELIQRHMTRTGDSARALQRRSGDRIGNQQWGQWAKNVAEGFPRVPTVRAIAETLAVPEQAVVLAFARTLGLDVRGAAAAVPLPAGSERIDEEGRRVIWDLAVRLIPQPPTIADALRATGRSGTELAVVAEVFQSILQRLPPESSVEDPEFDREVAALKRLRDEMGPLVERPDVVVTTRADGTVVEVRAGNGSPLPVGTLLARFDDEANARTADRAASAVRRLVGSDRFTRDEGADDIPLDLVAQRGEKGVPDDEDALVIDEAELLLHRRSVSGDKGAPDEHLDEVDGEHADDA